jgi:hypothetical protein
MRTVKQSCELQPGALDITVGDQVAQLEQLDQANAAAFFQQTHITDGMRQLLSEGMARLAGKSTHAVFHLKQAMGGGKTHLLVSFGLLARDRDLRKQVIPEIRYIDDFESARVAAFNGRTKPKEFFWGDIAKKLGKGDLFTQFWQNGPNAPGEEHWLELFDEGRPTLILLDELPPYFADYLTHMVGQGTVADIVTRAFANMLTAATKRPNVCIVVSDLSAAYETGSKLIQNALRDALSEIGRVERTITPVDLSSNEIYEILRKRLFQRLPQKEEVTKIAAAFRDILSEGVDSRLLERGADAIADAIPATYPFHPRFKNVVALFKENETYRQTRGLLELTSRLLRSVWNRSTDDVYLIGPQHFDLSDRDVRETVVSISGMSDVIASDVWDSQRNAHAQLIDNALGGDDAAQVASLLLISSLSTAVDAVRGLTEKELLECLAAPNRQLPRFREALTKLRESAWYLHNTNEGRYYFDRQENLTKLLQSIAKDAPENQIRSLLTDRLNQLFEPRRKVAYEKLLIFPTLDELSEEVRRARVLAILNPEEVNAEKLKDYFEQLDRKNNLLVLTGQPTSLAGLDGAARNVYAGRRGLDRLPANHPQREELQQRLDGYEKDLRTTILSLLDQLLIPRRRSNSPAAWLDARHIRWMSDQSQSFSGEESIANVLEESPTKLYSDVQENFGSIIDLAERLLWPESNNEAPWSDIVERYESDPAMVWLPPRGLDQVKDRACKIGRWEDLRNGWISRRPRKKPTSVQVALDGEPADDGTVRLRVTTFDAGPSPRVHYAEDGDVSLQSGILRDDILETTALQVAFLAVDTTGQHETGDPYIWRHPLKILSSVDPAGTTRLVTISVVPQRDDMEVRYTIDGSEPRNGQLYTGPFPIPTTQVFLQVYARVGNSERKEQRTIPEVGTGYTIDTTRPADAETEKGPCNLNSREDVYRALEFARQRKVTFRGVTVRLSEGNAGASATLREIDADADALERVIQALTIPPFLRNANVAMSFTSAHFQLGQDLEDFFHEFRLDLADFKVSQP